MEAILKRLMYGWHGPILVDQGFLSHLGWSFAIPLLGYWIGGRRWLWICGAAWVVHAFYRELIEEALEATTFSDLVSRIAPVAMVMALDALRRRRVPAPQADEAV
jgi:hypothetical protein